MSDADELCDQVAFLVDGEIRLVDSPRELKLRYGKNSVNVEYLSSGEPVQKTFSMKGLGRNSEFIHLLNENEVRAIHTQEATLDEIFIETTGQKLQ